MARWAAEIHQRLQAKHAAAALAAIRVRQELRATLDDGRVVFGRLTRVEDDVVEVLPYGCTTSLAIERASIKRVGDVVLPTWARYAAVCSRQRKGVFVEPAPADDVRDDTGNWAAL